MVAKYKISIAKPYWKLDIHKFEHPMFKDIEFRGILDVLSEKSFRMEGVPSNLGERPVCGWCGGFLVFVGGTTIVVQDNTLVYRARSPISTRVLRTCSYSTLILLKHYLSSKMDDFARAAGVTAGDPADGGVIR